MVGVVTACSQKGDLDLSRWVHSYIERNEISMSLVLCNAMLDMYGKCGNVPAAERLFDAMPVTDTISWTSLRLFDCMPVRDIAAWNAMVAAYEQGGRPKDALACLRKLRKTKLKPDGVTFVSALSACAQLGTLDSGKWIHALMSKQGINLNFYLATALIDMYSKCGDLDKAVEVFHSAKEKNVCCLEFAGYAMHGNGEVSIDLFIKMQDAGVKPNEVTLTNLLSACVTTEHYACMVDILGCDGLLKEAVELINSIQSLLMLLSGEYCLVAVIHRNVELGEHACAKLLELDPFNGGAYVMLSNIYAKAGKWDEATRVRKLKDIGLKKETGCSSNEVDGVVHEFLVGDTTYPLAYKVYLKPDEVASRLQLQGYVPNMSQLFLYIEEDDVKEQPPYLHSEKLAIAFGLINTTGPAPIRIVKNLRICSDCHSAAKLITIYNREILLRDRYRFHHVKEATCSCQDYW
ncbi:Pentatricopeptide repeat-containing protein [Nymphaea thermarum]|nr:Pentatricopeptide repeat-containing protein [Nymphaea thermarum]